MLSALCSAMVLAGGCIYDFDSCAATEDREDVKLRFTVVTRASYGPGQGKTRAADIDGDQEGSVQENYLNLAGRDIRFLLFDGEKKLLREFTPDADITPASGSNYVTYTVRATIAEPYFANVATAATDFYIMVIANCRPYSLSAFGLAPGATTIEDVADQLASFTMKTIFKDPETGGIFGWEPSSPGKADGEYIPMAGLQHFTLAKGAFNGKGPEDFVELSTGTYGKDINMLRALAKIEVIDRIGITGTFDGAARDVYVEKVGIFGYCATGTILPSYDQWNRNEVLETQQVTAPTMASHVVYKAPPTMNEKLETDDMTSYIEFHEDYAASEARNDKSPVFSVYVPEYLYDDDTIGESLRPFVRVNVNDPQNTENPSKFYMLRLAEYNGGTAGADIQSLLRNHIYRYEITALRNNSLQILYTLCPMDEATVTIPGFN